MILVIRILPFLIFSTGFLNLPAAQAEELTDPEFIITAYSDGPTLGIPRWKGYMNENDPDQFWMSYSNGNSSLGNITYSTDGCENWSSTIIQIDFSGWLDYHLSLYGKSGDLYYTWPGISTINFRKFNSPSHSNNDREAVVSFSGTSATHRSNVMVDGNDRIWVFTRLYNSPSQNVLYRYSDDNGLNWTSGTAFATNNAEVRIGSMPIIDGRPALIILYMESGRGYEYYVWNGSSFVANADASIFAQNMGYVRTFTHNVINDTTLHLIFGLGSDLHHCWKHYNNGTGSWHHQIIDYSANVLMNDWFPITTVRGDDMYLFYNKKSTSSEATSMIYYKKWSQITENWTDPVMVSTNPSNTYNRDANTCFQVPESSDYIPVFWRSGSSSPHSIYFSKILLDSAVVDTIPPGKINDLEAAP